MKVRTILLSSMVTGTALGLGITWADFGHNPDQLLPTQARPVVASDASDQSHLDIDETSHDFGTVEQGTTIQHAFVFHNRGPGILKLKPGSTTCSACTIAKLEKTEVLPGESTDVMVRYEARAAHPRFRQTATVLTNDPRQSRVELTISGNVTKKFDVRPMPMDFGNVPAGESATVSAELQYYLDGEIKVVTYEFGQADTAPLFDLKTVPMTAEQLSDLDAVSGQELVLSLKPGLPLGRFQQTIRLTLEMQPGGQTTEQTVPVVGTIVGDLTLVGPGWRGVDGVLSLGTVESDKGAKRKLTLLARGEARGDVTLEVGEVVPPGIRVTFGDRKPLTASIDQIPMEIEIPPGLPPAIWLGTQQGPFGEVVLTVKDHPHIHEFRINLKFIVK